MKALTSERLRRGALRAVKQVVVDKAPPPPDGRFTQELRRRFKGEVVAASEYLGRDLVTCGDMTRFEGGEDSGEAAATRSRPRR